MSHLHNDRACLTPASRWGEGEAADFERCALRTFDGIAVKWAKQCARPGTQTSYIEMVTGFFLRSPETQANGPIFANDFSPGNDPAFI
jgi:hypothetical protein